MSTGRSCTAGNVGEFASKNAVEWGACACGEGSNDPGDADEVPLFQLGAALACAGCCEDAREALS